MKYEERAASEQADAFGIGAPNDAYAQYFVGDSFLHPLTDPKECPVYMANVTFEPGCRNNWHIHHADKGGGQILVCTAGEGVYSGVVNSCIFCIRTWYILNRCKAL